jgi:hypothetical protein
MARKYVKKHLGCKVCGADLRHIKGKTSFCSEDHRRQYWKVWQANYNREYYIKNIKWFSQRRKQRRLAMKPVPTPESIIFNQFN